MTEWLLQPKPVKRGENVECAGSDAVINTILTSAKENTAQSSVLIPLNPDHLRRVFSYLTFFLSSDIIKKEPEAKKQGFFLIRTFNMTHRAAIR